MAGQFERCFTPRGVVKKARERIGRATAQSYIFLFVYDYVAAKTDIEI